MPRFVLALILFASAQAFPQSSLKQDVAYTASTELQASASFTTSPGRRTVTNPPI